MSAILSNLVLAVALLTGIAGVAALLRGLRLLRKPFHPPAQASLFLLFCTALLLSSCEKDPAPAADGEIPVLETATMVQDTLFLSGQFGPDRGTVLVNSQALPADDILSWQDDRIVCLKKPPIPEQLVVEVVVEQRKSQPRIITLSNDFRITYLMVDETQFQLYIFGRFGPDPGPGNRSVSINGVTIGDSFTEILVWSPSLITCRIRSSGPGASGEVVVSKGASLSASRMLNEWRGTLLYTRPQGGVAGSLFEYVWFDMVFRGDTARTIPAEARAFSSILSSEFNEISSAEYKAQGSAQCSYTLDGCATVQVNWALTGGDVFLYPSGVDYSGETHFNGYLTYVDGGFDIELNFEAWEVTPATITTYPCSGDPFVTTRNESIQFDAFEGETIALRFEGNAIKAGKLLQPGLGNNGALTWDFNEAVNQLVTATLEWETIAAKY